MALIECPDCGKQISDASLQCINCGRPMKRPVLLNAMMLGVGLLGVAVVYLGFRGAPSRYPQTAPLDSTSLQTVRRSTGTRSPQTQPSVDEAAYYEAMRSDLQNLAARQEAFYSEPENNYTYASSLSQLSDFEPSDGVSIVLINASQTGY